MKGNTITQNNNWQLKYTEIYKRMPVLLFFCDIRRFLPFIRSWMRMSH